MSQLDPKATKTVPLSSTSAGRCSCATEEKVMGAWPGKVTLGFMVAGELGFWAPVVRSRANSLQPCSGVSHSEGSKTREPKQGGPGKGGPGRGNCAWPHLWTRLPLTTSCATKYMVRLGVSMTGVLTMPMLGVMESQPLMSLGVTARSPRKLFAQMMAPVSAQHQAHGNPCNACTQGAASTLKRCGCNI